MYQTLKDSLMSGFPLSIGTGLALESLLDTTIPVFDENRIMPDKIDITKYNTFFINISTLLRNILSSLPSANITNISLDDYVITLIDEINIIQDLLTFSDMEPIFYVNNYTAVTGRFSLNKLRLPTTPKQLALANVHDNCLKNKVINDLATIFDDKIYSTDNSKSLILTHHPWDLLSHTKHIVLDLLESHTGVLKTKKDWYTKYYKIPNMDMSFIPFTELLLPIFGDNVFLHPDPINKRLEMYERLRKMKINPLTNDDVLKIYLSRF